MYHNISLNFYKTWFPSWFIFLILIHTHHTYFTHEFLCFDRRQVQLCGEVRFRQTLPWPGVLRSGPDRHILQRDSGGPSELHMAQLQVRGSLRATAQAATLPKHDHRLPKHTRNTYRTTLNYNGNRNAAGHRRFVSTVRLESTEDVSPCIIYTEDLWETHMRDVLSFPKFKNSLWLESYSESTWTKTLIQRRMLSEGHFVLLLPVTLVLDGGDELVLSVCLWSLHVFYVSVMYLCTSGIFSSRTSQVEGKASGEKTVSAVCWFRGPQNSMKDLQIYTELKRMSVKNAKN